MSFQWELGESVKSGIARLITEQVDHALSELKSTDNDRDEAVHQARKSFKKIRAILRLVREEVGEDYYQEKNAFYRDLGRALSPLRDAFVVVETLDTVTAELTDKSLKKSAKALRKKLYEKFLQTRESFWKDDSTIPEVIKALESEHSQIDDIPINHDSFKAFKKGMRKIYRQGQNRMEVAYANIPSSEGFHDWRKRVKYLWNQMRILEPIYPAHLTPLVTQLDQLSELLGEANDLAVLYERLEAYNVTDDGSERLLLAYLDQKRGNLEMSARPFGALIYEMDAKSFTKQIKSWWESPEPIIA